MGVGFLIPDSSVTTRVIATLQSAPFWIIIYSSSDKWCFLFCIFYLMNSIWRDSFCLNYIHENWIRLRQLIRLSNDWRPCWYLHIWMDPVGSEYTRNISLEICRAVGNGSFDSIGQCCIWWHIMICKYDFLYVTRILTRLIMQTDNILNYIKTPLWQTSFVSYCHDCDKREEMRLITWSDMVHPYACEIRLDEMWQ